MVQVFHNSRFIEDGHKKAFDEPVTTQLAAIVETEDLEEAYRLTNNIDTAWPENKGVRCYTKSPRSTSMGDVLLRDHIAYVVAAFGFRKLSKEEMKFVSLDIPQGK